MARPSSETAGQFAQLPLDQIDPHPKNPREDWDIDPLAVSLAQYRILTPILVRELRIGAKVRWQIIGGHRRWAAAKQNGWSVIGAMICEATDEQALALLAAENQHRKSLNQVELARLITTLHDEAQWTDRAISDFFEKKSSSWATNMRRLLKLPADLLELVKQRRLHQSAARTLLKYQDQPNLLNRIAADMLNNASEWKTRAQIEVNAAAMSRGETIASPCKASDDFTSVLWYGAKYHFSKSQAAAVGLLWNEWKKGGLTLSEKTIGERIGSASDRFRLSHLFRSAGRVHPAWGVMIQSAGKGVFRLQPPQS